MSGFALRRCLLALAVAWAATGCVAPGLRGVHETIYRDVAFAHPNGRAICLDLYVPPARRPPPVVVWFHGGAWKYGDKRFHFLVRELTRSGLAVASVQYRLTWSVQWPAPREDCLASIDWLKAHGRAYGIDPDRLGLSGESAGGHLAALLGEQEGTPRVKAVLAMYPPTDMTALAKRYRFARHFNLVTDLFGEPYERSTRITEEASPIRYVSAHSPPFLFIHGDHDPVVPIAQSREMDARLRSFGVESQLIVMPGYLHGFGLDKERLQKVAEFFKKHL